MKNLTVVICPVSNTISFYSQKLNTAEGDIKALKGITDYQIIFEYVLDMQIPNYNLEYKKKENRHW